MWSDQGKSLVSTGAILKSEVMRVDRTYLAVIDVSNGTNVHMGLRALENSVRPVHVHELCGVLLLERSLERAGVAILEAMSGGPQERRN